MSESEANFILDKAKKVGDALPITISIGEPACRRAGLFNEVQDKMLPLVAIW